MFWDRRVVEEGTYEKKNGGSGMGEGIFESRLDPRLKVYKAAVWGLRRSRACAKKA